MAMAEKPFRNLGALSVLITLVTLGSTALGFVREVLISARFGASGETDAFYLLFSLLVLSSLSLTRHLPRAFIPEYQSRLLKDPKGGASYFGITLALLAPIMTCIAIVIIGWTGQAIDIFAPGFTGQTHTDAISLARIFAAILPAAALMAVVGSIAQARGHILLVQLTTPLVNLGTILGLLLLDRSLGIQTAAIGLTAGCFAQLLVLLAYPFVEKLKPSFDAEALRPALHGLGILGLLVVLNYSGGMFATVIERLFSSRLAEGHLSCMGYAMRLVSLPNGIVLRTLNLILLPAVAYLVVRKNSEEVERLTLRSLRMLLLMELPLLLGMAMFASPLVELVYGRGAFSAEAGTLTSSLIICYLPAMLSEGVRAVLVTVFFAYSRPGTPFAFGVIRVVGLALAYSLTWESFGAKGMVLGQSGVDVAITVALVVLTQRKLGVRFASLGPFLVRLLLVTIVGLAVAWAVHLGLLSVIEARGAIQNTAMLLAAVSAAVVSTLILAPRVGLDEVGELLALLKGTLSKLLRR